MDQAARRAVGVAEALQTCADILDGAHDDLPTAAFYFSGGIDDIRRRAASGG